MVFIDHRFSRMAERQVLSVLPECKLEPYKINNNNTLNTAFFKLEAKDTSDDVPGKIKGAASSFVDFVMPVDAVIEMRDPIEYQKIEDVLSKVIDNHKYSSFKIEVKKIDRMLDGTAKSVEVQLGGDLEKRGYKADLNTPEVMVYAVLLKDSVIVGHVDTHLQKDYILDSFRQASKEGGDELNRAEFKIKEAIEFFGIDLNKHKRGLDIGAAPGGWTHYLSQHGIKVVAVDNALLDYKKISNGKSVLVLADEVNAPQIRKMIASEGLTEKVYVEGINDQSAEVNRYDIVHIKANMDQNNRIELLKKFGRFDILAIDTNTSPLESATIANSLVELLDSEASLIMTTKLITRGFSKHISTVEAELSKNYKSIQLKKLSHNRRELTAYGIFNGNQREFK
ncbi:MAG: THUMP domain-containing class I SAM-dependent methyltransferase [Candidatus Micrarchaeales archaeon]